MLTRGAASSVMVAVFGRGRYQSSRWMYIHARIILNVRLQNYSKISTAHNKGFHYVWPICDAN